jgi:hypothetical protein
VPVQAITTLLPFSFPQTNSIPSIRLACRSVSLSSSIAISCRNAPNIPVTGSGFVPRRTEPQELHKRITDTQITAASLSRRITFSFLLKSELRNKNGKSECHSRESGNPEEKGWIPAQGRNDSTAPFAEDVYFSFQS